MTFSAVPLPYHGVDMDFCSVVTIQLQSGSPTISPDILHWPPSKLAEWIASCNNMRAELQILANFAMTQAKWTVWELNQILANNLVPNGDGGHLRTLTILQWKCELYNARPKARRYQFDLDGHHWQVLQEKDTSAAEAGSSFILTANFWELNSPPFATSCFPATTANSRTI